MPHDTPRSTPTTAEPRPDAPAITQDAFRFLAVTPFELADLKLCRAWLRQGGACALDIGRNEQQWAEHFQAVGRFQGQPLGLRIPDHVSIDPGELPGDVPFLILTAERDIGAWARHFTVIVQVHSREEAEKAAAAGAAGLIAKGHESGGLIGEQGSFVLLQALLGEALPSDIPVWSQGGIGIHTAAGAFAAGAFGVVLDAQLALLNEAGTAPQLRQQLEKLDGGETRVLHGYRVQQRPNDDFDEATLTPETVRTLITTRALYPIGQDAALAKHFQQRCKTAESLINLLRTSVSGHLHQAKALNSLGENSPLAQAHGTRYPIAQGPMTRVSDSADFALAVAENGGLPFLALSLMKEQQSHDLLEETAQKLQGHSWGAGVLGFAEEAILKPQMALIKRYRPPVVLIAGGRPSQARELEELGITCYLHVPAPGLLDMFLKDGARHFIFEGQECGGHVGPRNSFVLWEQQIEKLLHMEDPQTLHILFAGGIHDERSAAMVAAIAAPLAARGAKIGVLMGTAYMATREAIDSGAIIDEFQRQMLECEHTVLLETAPGHATRCVDTEFAQFFEAEKKRLQEQGLDRHQVWAELEQLNVGRLRIAAKGVDRQGSKLVPVDADGQHRDGMYMIGQIAALRHQATTMGELHTQVTRGACDFLDARPVPPLLNPQAPEPVAVVGMQCIYPGSPDLDSYWSNILAGKDLVSEVPAERWNASLYYEANAMKKDGKTPSKWGGFIDDFPFDPLAYGIPPQSMAAIEPIQLLSLEVARRALADAGYSVENDDFDREKTSVIFGAESGMDLSNAYAFRNGYQTYLGEMPAELDAVLPRLTEDSFPGVLANVIAGRIANRLDLGGVNYTVDSACASSLTAVELALKELRSGSSDMVLAGGADFHNSINDFLMFSSVTALSPTGRCRPFDSKADGIALGEGVGVVVLKRLSDAQRDGDRIYAVINGAAGSSDGKSLGLTAPRKEGQKRALERAYWQAGLMPGDVSLVEAHGTGTVVGDGTELQTLTEIYAQGGALNQRANLGSVKSQIGHTKCAAGIAGLIKISLALHHRVLPPTMNIEQPHGRYNPKNSPFVLDSKPRPWLEKQRHAALSAFGFGGTNFHAVLGSAPETGAPETSKGQPLWPCELFVFRGENFDAARQRMQQLSEFLSTDVPLQLRDLSYSLSQQRGPVQCVFVAEDLETLRERLEQARNRQRDNAIHYREEHTADSDGKIAFLFPGQGSQSPGMLRELFVGFPELRPILEAGLPWAQKLFPPTAWDKASRQQQQAAITDTRVAQPTLGMADYAMATVLAQLGLEPDMLAGHSYGELVALCVAGCMDLETLLKLSGARGEAILAAAGTDAGTMAAVSAGREQLESLLADIPDVVLANQNSPKQTVISGTTPGIDKALKALSKAEIAARPIEVACAFHSPVVAQAETLFADTLAGADIQAMADKVFSNTSAEPYPNSVEAIKARLAQHIVNPVRFVEQIEAMYAAGARTFVEVGPGRVLSGLVKSILGDRPHRIISTDRKGESSIRSLLNATAQMLAAGIELDLDYLFQGRNAREWDLSEVPQLPKTTWWINGQRARPVHGELPRHAAKPILEPLTSLTSGAAAVAPETPEENAVIHYLNNVRDLVHAQRDVMMGMFGQQPPASAAPPPVAERVAEPSAAPAEPTPAPAEPAAPKLDVTVSLLAIVSERTGYPDEMLELDLDLEADLSIDSIKRLEITAELADKLGFKQALGADADAMMEQLAAKKTLREIIAWVEEQVPTNTPEPSPAPAPEPSAPAPAEPAPATAVDARVVLLKIVSDRTGYPEEALDLDLDLEADLSIDSIKRLEIVGELGEQLGLADKLADKDQAMEELAALKTLHAILEWLADKAGDATIPAEAPAALDADADASSSDDSEEATPKLSRYVLKTSAAPQAVRGEAELEGSEFVITDDSGGIAQALAKRLEAHGARARVINFGEHDPLPEDIKDIDGLIHLWGLNPEARVRDVKRFFNLVRETLLNKTSYLLVAGGLGGGFGHYSSPNLGDSDIGQGGGLAGMVKSVVKEWPEIRAHWVDLDLSEPADELAAYLEIELLAENPLTEVGYHQGTRRLVEVVESTIPASGEEGNKLGLNKDSVVLITGGAKGITAEVATTLARRYGCHLELVGRSAAPSGEEPPEIAACEDLKALRKTLIKQNPGLSPVEIEKRCSAILSQREGRETLRDIELVGGSVRYHQIDVRDIEAFGQLIESLYREHGRIDGVIHGAGIIEDKLLRHKTADSFERVFDTKVRGAMMLSKLLRDDVKFVVFFSSVAGAFGNKGQVDYASANDVLDKIAHSLQARVQGRVLSVNWGPWAGRGMVMPELEREYARKGIGLIPLDEGIDALMRELQHGEKEDTQIVLMCATPESMDMAY